MIYTPAAHTAKITYGIRRVESLVLTLFVFVPVNTDWLFVFIVVSTSSPNTLLSISSVGFVVGLPFPSSTGVDGLLLSSDGVDGLLLSSTGVDGLLSSDGFSSSGVFDFLTSFKIASSKSAFTSLNAFTSLKPSTPWTWLTSSANAYFK